MRNLCLTLSRFAVSAWVGAACLFVVTTLREVHSTKLDSVAKSELAVLRFPAYYMFAFSLIGAALVFAACSPPAASKLRRWTSLSLLLIVFLMTTVDYFWIYKPLVNMTAVVDKARPAEFIRLHRASRWINTGQVCLSVIAAFTICRPMTRRLDAPSSGSSSSAKMVGPPASTSFL